MSRNAFLSKCSLQLVVKDPQFHIYYIITYLTDVLLVFSSLAEQRLPSVRG